MEGSTVSLEVPFPEALVAKVGNRRIIRSVYLSSTEKLNKIIDYAGNSRLAFVQYNPEEDAWRKIVHEHRSLSKIKQPHVHLSLPILPPFYPKPLREKTYHEKEIADTLPKLLNMEGWAMYSSWLHEKFEKSLQQFKFDAIDEYTLEAYLEDFRHEVFSDLLSNNLKSIHLIDNRSTKRTLEEEKELIKLRQELRRMIETHKAILAQIIVGIQAIEEVHPELLEIEELSILLNSVLENQLLPFDRVKLPWGLQEICLQLLDDALGIQPILNCSQDHGRTYFAMALRIAIMQLKGNHPVRELIEMIHNWDKNADTPLVKKFKYHVQENLNNIHKIKPVNEKETSDPGLISHPEYLNYIT